MSELTAIYNYLESNIAKEAISSSIEEFFENLTAAGFDVETALAEAAKLDNRLGGLGSIKNINEYAQSKKSSNIDKLVDSINIDYPGSLQEVLNYCLLNNEGLSAVAGGVGGNTRIIKNFSTNSSIVKDDVKVELRDFAKVAEVYVEDYAYIRENPIKNINAGDKNSTNAPGYDAGGNITRESEISTFIDGPSGVNSNE
jgi:hypothetical protein